MQAPDNHWRLEPARNATTLSENATHDRRKKVSGSRLLDGEVSEARRQGDVHYPTVALRYESSDVMRVASLAPFWRAAPSDRLWEIGDIVKLIEAAEAEAAPKARGPYKKRS